MFIIDCDLGQFLPEISFRIIIVNLPGACFPTGMLGRAICYIGLFWFDSHTVPWGDQI